MHPAKLVNRRTLGLGAIGLAAVATLDYRYSQRSYLQHRSPAPVCGPVKSYAMSNTEPPVKAVNLRDIGEVDPRLRKGVLYRCSQIYTPDVLRDLKIKTVVDLRGRAEKHKHKHKKGKNSSHGPPPLLTNEQAEAMAGRSTVATDYPAGGDTPAAEAYADATEEMMITKLQRQNSGLSSASESDTEGSDTGSSNGNKPRVVKAQSAKDLAAGLTEDAYTGAPERETFNLIPPKEFGFAMAKMPWHVWRKSLLNLATGRDPRRPFVDAFADEQLLGFTKYYIIILEHAKKNIAGTPGGALINTLRCLAMQSASWNKRTYCFSAHVMNTSRCGHSSSFLQHEQPCVLLAAWCLHVAGMLVTLR
eukprot:GHRR01004293.1.p1 GENE.GHRR01004293.1~~GHRR01004293.1.p1  ORF type:complete len:361 (+),score=74.80 GHRR01004293.1:253-1335(+)